MATRSNIYVKLQQESKGQTLKFNPELINPEYSTEYPIPDVQIPENANFIGVYHHWDGYLSGLGKTLLTEYQDYEKILNVVMMGDLSTINDRVESYRGWRNEDCPANFYTEDNLKPEDALREEYAYLFDNGKWFVCYKSWNSEKKEYNPVTDWLPLDEEIKKEEEE